MSVISRRVAQELSDLEFRNSYKRARVRSKLVYQMRSLRKQRDWLQGKLAEVLGKPQSTVSRFEDADYGKLTLESIFEISDAFDVGVVVEFVSYPEFLVRTSNLTPDVLQVASFSEKSLAFLVRDIAVPMAHTQHIGSTERADIRIDTTKQAAIMPFASEFADASTYKTEILGGTGHAS